MVDASHSSASTIAADPNLGHVDRSSRGILLLAATVAGTVILTAWHGVDLPSQMYRQNLTRSFGFLVWDAWWYTGHYLVSYSVLSPVVAAVIGLPFSALVAAVVSAWAFDRLLKSHGSLYGPRRLQAASVLFALNTATPILIGQVTFLMGEAVGLLAILAAYRRRKVLTVVLACMSTLFSPVAGLFVALALVTWIIAEPTDRGARGIAAAAAIAPMVASSVLFHEFGSQPFLGPALAVVLACCIGGLLFIPRQEKVLRWGCALYGLGAVATFIVPNPLGGNIVRLAGCVAAPLAITMVRFDRRKLASLGAGLLIIWTWTPAISGLVSANGDPSRHVAYFTPLTTELKRQPQPERVEIPFTKQHWEAAFVAPHVPLARGWERQTDRAKNPIFYSPAPVTAAAYKSWLYRNGVTWVALPNVPLDYSAVKEAALVRSGLPYLQLTWSNPNWTLWKVTGSPGLLDGPASLSMPAPDKLILQVARPSTLTVRVRYTPTWHVTVGAACLSATPQGWTRVQVSRPGRVELVAQPGLTSYECPVAQRK